MKPKRVFILSLVVLLVCNCVFTSLIYKYRTIFPDDFYFTGGKKAYIHFSVDDTVMIFDDLTKNEKEYVSIFENEILSSCKKLHDKYNAVFSFYCFYDFMDICLKQATDKYAEQFTANSDWLKFDMFDDSDWNGTAPLVLSDERRNSHIVIKLKNRAGISIREYSTEVSTDKDNMPDYIHLSLHDDEKTPVIPGSSWAGAFRERFTVFTGTAAMRNLFGYVEQKKKDETTPIARKSRITFSESRLSGGQWKKLTRNSLDRFSSATKEGNLYTEQTYYGGETELEIIVDREALHDAITPLSCVLKDLHFGYLAVGGLTAVGRGLFEITEVKVDGMDVTDKITSPDVVLNENDIISDKGGEEHNAE